MKSFVAHILLYKNSWVKMQSWAQPLLCKILMKGDVLMAILRDKKAIIIGDRDGIPGQAIAECAVSAGAEVVFSSTECFV